MLITLKSRKFLINGIIIMRCKACAFSAQWLVMLKAIKSKQQYENILARIYTLMQQKVKAGSQLFLELEVLTVLASVYEMTHKPAGL